ncbi:hypothetical protein CM318V1_290004 [Carnobacterium maltaromaticum]|uniref:hypothetical protein n=1 Tax=Carnobacterium maltaromaticum TaxID=2751 RepID=UPI0007051502|nr:hypothetical protein [Carnobacterium maltaromaticum]KRN70682.1 hypothetical protein IV76_GL001601 [Carnobacterium maltaromaticum]CRH18752.1 hypothetical protein CM318V1_290004 [Carnobacterium maltaromaticum]
MAASYYKKVVGGSKVRISEPEGFSKDGMTCVEDNCGEFFNLSFASDDFVGFCPKCMTEYYQEIE